MKIPFTKNGKPKRLSAAEILDLDDRPSISVPMPEWGCEVLMRPLNLLERFAWMDAQSENDGSVEQNQLVSMRLACLSLVDEAGEPVFSVDQAEALLRKNDRAAQRLMDSAMHLNRFTKSAMEEDAGNSEGGLTAAYSSESPEKQDDPPTPSLPIGQSENGAT